MLEKTTTVAQESDHESDIESGHESEIEGSDFSVDEDSDEYMPSNATENESDGGGAKNKLKKKKKVQQNKRKSTKRSESICGDFAPKNDHPSDVSIKHYNVLWFLSCFLLGHFSFKRNLAIETVVKHKFNLQIDSNY